MDYGNGLISSVYSTGNLAEAIESGIKRDFFTEERDQVVWDWTIGYFNRHGLAPGPEDLEANYPSYSIGTYRQPMSVFVEGLFQRRRDALAVNAAQNIVEALNIEGPDRGGEAFTVMNQAVLQAHFETSGVRHVNFVDKIRRSYPEWEHGTSAPAIDYGIPSLTLATGGIRMEQFIILSGLAKSRKTWTMLHMAANVHAAGYPVAFVTFEMSNDEIAERLGTLIAKLPYQMVRDKMGLTPAHRKQMERYLNLRDMLPPFTGVEDIAQNSTVTSLQALVQDVRPAVLFIDGIYLMTDEVTGEVGRENKPLSNISGGLKRLAKSQKVAVVGSTQQLHGKTYKGRTSLFGIGYTSAFSQDADVLVGVEATEDKPNIATMRIHGNRSGPQNTDFDITWNLETGLVEEVTVDEEDVADYDDIDTYT